MSDLPNAPWEQDHYSYSGPGVAISCDVAYDPERECYVATGSSGHVGTGDNHHTAALACFEAWMTNRHAYYQQPPDQGG